MRKFFAGLILFILLLIVPALSFTYAALETYLNPDFYTNETVIGEIYDTVTEYAANNIVDILQTENTEGLIDPQDLADQIKTILPKDDILSITQDIVDQITEVPLPDTITIDISVIKKNLPEVAGNALEDLVYNMKECPEKSISDFDIENGEMITCIPSDLKREELLRNIAIEDSMFDDIPSETEIDLTVLPDNVREATELIIQNNQNLKSAILAIFFAFVTIIALIIFKPISSVLKWTGNTLFWSGLPLAIINLTINGTMEVLIPKLAEESPELSQAMIEEGMETTMVLIRFLTDKAELHGIVLTIAGALLIILGLILTRTNDDKS